MLGVRTTSVFTTYKVCLLPVPEELPKVGKEEYPAAVAAATMEGGRSRLMRIARYLQRCSICALAVVLM